MKRNELLFSEFNQRMFRLLESLAIGSIPFETLHPLILDLEQLVFEMDAHSEPSQRLLDELSRDQKAALNLAYCIWETELERRFVDNNNGSCRVEDYLLDARFGRLIHRELNLLAGFSPKKILFVGSGPFPISAIHYHKRLNVPVDCLERNPAAVLISNAAVRKLGLQNDISIFLGEGEKFAMLNYDLIIIALLAKPKNLILANVFKNTTPDCRVICRTSEGLRTVLYEPTIEKKDTPSFRIDGFEHAGNDDTISSLLLRTKIGLQISDHHRTNGYNYAANSSVTP